MSNKKGFTLVELSIVLVIIGLLIGGILVGQSLVDTSKIQSFVKQVGQYDAAFASFKDKYNQLPGDSDKMGALAGNNNGIIASWSSGLVNYYGGETAEVWHDLAIAGLKLESGSDLTSLWSGYSSGTMMNSLLPKSPLGNDASFFVFGVSGAHYYAVSNFGTFTSPLTMTDAFLAADVLAIDTKMDDGLAAGGNVKGTDATSTASITAATGGLTTGTDCTTTAAGNTYDVAEEAETCSIRIRIGSTIGTLY